MASQPLPKAPELSPVPASSCLAEAILTALDHVDRSVRSAAIAEAARVVDPDELVTALADEENSIRRNSAMSALTKGGGRSVPALLRSLRDPDPEVVTFAATLLGRTRDAAAIPHLVSILDHPDINVVQAAIDSLAQLRPRVAVDALVRVLDRDPWLRFAAVNALGEIGDPRAIAPLLPLLQDELVRDAVIEALGRIASADALAALAAILHDCRDGVTFAACLRAIGEALVHHPDETALAGIAEWSQLAADQAGLQASLMQVLEPDAHDFDVTPDDLATKGAAASIVRALRLRPLYTALVLAGRHPKLRDLLQFCVVSIGAEIAPSLGVGLESTNPNVVALACRCVGAIGIAELAPRIATLLVRDDDQVRVAAIDALARLQATDAVRPIARLLDDASERVSDAARAALATMDADAVTSALLWLKVDPTAYGVRQAVLQIMRANPNPRQIGFVRAALADPHGVVRAAAVEALAAQPGYDAVKPLEPLLVDPVLGVRKAAVSVIGRSRDARVRELLLAQIERDPATRLEAIRAIAKCADAGVVQHLIEIYDREPEHVRLGIIEALADMRQPIAEPMLVRLLADGSVAVRCAAVGALAAFASEAAMRHVVICARDGAWQVREAVAQRVATTAQGGVAALERLCVDANAMVADVARRRLAAEETRAP